LYNEVILVGVAVSMLFSELTGFSPAGLIVPGYIALSLGSPLRIGYTLVLSALSALICRGLGRFVILYGRRRFALMILLAFGLGVAVERSGFLPFRVEAIGYLIPGIIAREMDRQGFWKTILSLALATALVALIAVVADWPLGGLL